MRIAGSVEPPLLPIIDTGIRHVASDVDDDLDDEEEELELVLFQGATNGAEPDLRQNARLVEAGLVPAKRLVTDGISRRAETIVVEPKGQAARIKLEVDGIPYPGGRLPQRGALAVTQMLKLLSGLEPKERKRPQRGGLKAEYEDKPYTVSVATDPIAGGAERLTIRILDHAVKLGKPDEIGLSNEVRDRVRALTNENGFVLACGAPHSGVTTTLLGGVLGSVDAYIYSVVSLTDTGGRDILGVAKYDGNPDDDVDTKCARIIRAENDVILVDPIKDGETFQAYAKHAEDLVIIGEFAARDTASGLAQLVQWSSPEVVCEKVRGLVSQRLIRRLCTKCKFAYRPHPKLLAKVGLPSDTKVLYKPPPPPAEDEEEEAECRRCGGLDYYGRVGMFEVLRMSDAVKEAVRAGGDAAAIRAAMKKDGQPSLQQDGVRLVAEGVTSLEEVQRVFKPAGPKKKKRRRPSP